MIAACAPWPDQAVREIPEIEPEITARAIEEELRERASRMVSPVCGVLACLLLILAVNLLAAQAGAETAGIASLAGGSAGFLLVAAAAAHWWKLPGRWAHPALSFAVGLALVNGLYVLLASPDLSQLTQLVLLLLAAGGLFLSTGWFMVTASPILAGWSALVILQADQSAWPQIAITLILAASLASLFHFQRLRATRAMVRLKMELAAQARALADARRDAQAQASRFELVNEAALEAVFVHEGGVVLEANAAAAKLFGRARAEMAGLKLFELTPPECHEALRGIDLADKTKFELFAQKKDGSVVQVQYWSTSFNRKGGRVTVTSARDITQESRQQERQELEKSRILADASRNKALAQAAAIARGADSSAEAAEEILHLLDRAFPVSLGSVFLIRNSDCFKVLASTVPTAGVGLEIIENTSRVFQLINQSRQPLLLSDLARDPFAVGELFPAVPLKAMAAVPFVEHGAVRSILLVLERVPRAYKGPDIEFLNSILASCLDGFDRGSRHGRHETSISAAGARG